MQRSKALTLIGALLVGGFVVGLFLVQGSADAGDKVTICHIPPGNPANFHTISVSANAVDKHMENHGDFLGECCGMIANVCGVPGDKCKAYDCAADECSLVDVECGDIACMDLAQCDPVEGCQYTNRVCPEGEVCNPDTNACEVETTCPCETSWVAALDGALPPTTCDVFPTGLGALCVDANGTLRTYTTQEISSVFCFDAAFQTVVDSDVKRVAVLPVPPECPPNVQYEYTCDEANGTEMSITQDEYSACLAAVGNL